MEFQIEYKTPEKGIKLYTMTFICENGSFQLKGSIDVTSCHAAFAKHRNDVIVRFNVSNQTMKGNLDVEQVESYLPKIIDFFTTEALSNVKNAAFIKLNKHIYPTKGCSNPIANRKQKKRVSAKRIGGKWVENYRKVYNPHSGGW